MTVNVVSFSFSWCSTRGPEATLLGDGFLYGILSASAPDLNSSRPKGPFGLMWLFLPHLVYNSLSNATATQLAAFCSIRRPYITFKLPRGDMDTPPQFLPISGDRDVSLPLSLEWPVWSSSSGNNCHAVHRSLSSDASVYECTMGIFLARAISSANFRPRDFLS